MAANTKKKRGWIPKADASIPLQPERNPPAGIDDLAKLIDVLEEKALKIKTDVDSELLLSAEDRDVEWLSRAMCAKTRTCKSISKLQKLLKERKLEANRQRNKDFYESFFLHAKTMLAPTVLEVLIDAANGKFRN